jgi:hypothetical protein
MNWFDRRRRRGSGALEFALTLPFLLAVLLGIVELSMLMHRHYVISRSARDACRVASGVVEGMEPTGALIEAAALDHARFALQSADLDCDLLRCELLADWHDEDGRMLLTVEVSVPYTPVTRLFPLVPDETRRRFTMLTRQQAALGPP